MVKHGKKWFPQQMTTPHVFENTDMSTKQRTPKRTPKWLKMEKIG
jgi:hypothetical protein